MGSVQCWADRRAYVQDRIREQGALVWRLLQAGGCVYVCGSPQMRAAVRAAFTDVITEHGRLGSFSSPPR